MQLHAHGSIPINRDPNQLTLTNPSRRCLEPSGSARCKPVRISRQDQGHCGDLSGHRDWHVTASGYGLWLDLDGGARTSIQQREAGCEKSKPFASKTLPFLLLRSAAGPLLIFKKQFTSRRSVAPLKPNFIRSTTPSSNQHPRMSALGTSTSVAIVISAYRGRRPSEQASTQQQL